jgi:hypothetical protein
VLRQRLCIAWNHVLLVVFKKHFSYS